MRQYRETIRSPLPIIIKFYLLYFALPAIILLPVVTVNLIKLIPHTHHYSGGLFNLYTRCYSGGFLFFIIPILIFLAFVAYGNKTVLIVIKNDRLFLPVRTGELDGGRVTTVIPLQDIISLEMRKPTNNITPNSANHKEYSITCEGYTGDYLVVRYSRAKNMVLRILANLSQDTDSYECEQVQIEFPSTREEEIKQVIKQDIAKM